MNHTLVHFAASTVLVIFSAICQTGSAGDAESDFDRTCDEVAQAAKRMGDDYLQLCWELDYCRHFTLDPDAALKTHWRVALGEGDDKRELIVLDCATKRVAMSHATVVVLIRGADVVDWVSFWTSRHRRGYECETRDVDSDGRIDVLFRSPLGREREDWIEWYQVTARGFVRGEEKRESGVASVGICEHDYPVRMRLEVKGEIRPFSIIEITLHLRSVSDKDVDLARPRPFGAAEEIESFESITLKPGQTVSRRYRVRVGESSKVTLNFVRTL